MMFDRRASMSGATPIRWTTKNMVVDRDPESGLYITYPPYGSRPLRRTRTMMDTMMHTMMAPSQRLAPRYTGPDAAWTTASPWPVGSPKTCAWAGCGAQLSTDPAQQLKCARCNWAFYCDRACQKKHWRRGGHKAACKEPPCCTICLQGGDEPLPMRRGCGCVGDNGLAHVACMSKMNVYMHKDRGSQGWRECPTCGLDYTGGMQLALARELVRLTEWRAPEDHHRLGARVHLGNALVRAGQYKLVHTGHPTDAEALLGPGHLLAISRHLLTRHQDKLVHLRGPAHKCLLRAARALGHLHHNEGRCTQAVDVCQPTLAAMQRVLGPEHPIALDVATQFARCLSAQGRHIEAEPLFRSALKAQLRVLGPEHRDTLNTMHRLAWCLGAQNQHTEAEPLFWSVLRGRLRVLGPQHRATNTTVHRLAWCLCAQGRHAKAEPYLRLALEWRRLVLGPEHRATLDAAHLLARCLSDQDRRAEAEPFFRFALKGRLRVLGPEHRATLHTTQRLAWCLGAQDRYAEAEPLFRSALDARIRMLGPVHRSTLHTMHCLAWCLGAQGRYAEAEPFLLSALEGRWRLLGPEHVETLETSTTLIRMLCKDGRHREAEPFFRSELAEPLFRSVLGPQHGGAPRTATPQASFSLVQFTAANADRVARTTTATTAKQ